MRQKQQPIQQTLSFIALLLSSLAIGLCLGYTIAPVLKSVVGKPSQSDDPYPLGAFEHGFATEMSLPQNIYELEQRRFNGGVGFHPDKSEFLLLDHSSEPVYVGDPPTREMDRAWEELVSARYWSISREEAKTLWGVGFEQYRDEIKGGYTGGFDVFHVLHCLNMLRRRLHPDHYDTEHVHLGGSEHDAHCIDQIRQRIQCYGTGTITPGRYSENLQDMYVDSAQVHTCRNFQKLWEYTRERYNGSLAVPRIPWRQQADTRKQRVDFDENHL